MQALESLGPVAHDTAILVQEDPGNAGLNWRVLGDLNFFWTWKTDCGSCVKFTEIFFCETSGCSFGVSFTSWLWRFVLSVCACSEP